MRIKGVIVLSMVLVILLCLSSCSCSHSSCSHSSCSHSKYYEKYLPYKSYFGLSYSTIDYQCSEKEKAEVADVLTLAKRVFSYVGTETNADKNVGALTRYYRYTDTLSFNSVDLQLDLITAKVNRNNGYMWVVYSVNRYDNNGNIVNGSSDIPCYWKIEKRSNQWIVTDIIEPA